MASKQNESRVELMGGGIAPPSLPSRSCSRLTDRLPASLGRAGFYLFVPTVAALLVSAFVPLVHRATFNLDYMIPLVASVALPPLVTSTGFALVWLLDIGEALAQSYYLSLGYPSSIPNLLTVLSEGQPGGHLLGLIVLLAVTALGLFYASYRFLLSSRDGHWLVVPVAALLTVPLVVGDRALWDYGDGVHRRFRFPSWNLVGSQAVLVFNRNARARGTRPQLTDVEAATDSLYERVRASGLRGRNVLVVVVESFGVPRDSVLRNMLFESVGSARLIERGYRIERRTIETWGSTVAAELRELCGVKWLTVSPHPEGLSEAACLPALFADAGYTTACVHGFHSRFFNRYYWWPLIGCERVLFEGELSRLGYSARCGGGFRGVCDSTVGRWVARHMAEQDSAFVYWLTLNSHPPGGLDPPGAFCSDTIPDLLSAEQCRVAFAVRQTLSTVADLVAEAGRPPYVVVVGDHPPGGSALDEEVWHAREVPALLLSPGESDPWRARRR